MSTPLSMPYQNAFTEVEESSKVNRWGSGPSEEGYQNFFMRYASGNQMSRQQAQTIRSGGVQSQKRYTTEISHVSYADKFKKMKYNQMQTLKQLRQEYEILRNSPMQVQFLNHSHNKKQSVSDYSSHREADANSQSTSSKHTHRKKHRESHSAARDTQVLTMEKRQLELVIGNSMRKIQELLNNEIEYKKIIHELQMQLDSRSSEDKLEGITKTMKKNETELNERIQSLKRDIQRLKLINQQLIDKNDALEAELSAKNLELRKCRDEKRVLQDSVRVEKDKYMNLQIQIKRLRMESEINQKDKNSEINRLKNLLDSQPKFEQGASQSELRKLEEELRSSKHKYQMLLHEFERYKRDISERPKQVVIKEVKNDDQLKMFQTLIAHLRQDASNQNRASMDLLASMVAKIDEKNERQREKNTKEKRKQPNQQGLETSNRILEEVFNLRNEVSTMRKERDELGKSQPLINNLTESMADYQNKIRKLQDEIADGTITKENLIKEYETLKSSYNYTREQYDKLLAEHQKLKERLSHTEHHGQISNQEMRNSFREREGEYEDTIRQLRRQLDEALFMADKARKEGQFNVSLARSQSQSQIRLSQQQASRVQGQKQVLRQQLLKMRGYYEGKIQQKNALLEKTAQEYAVLCETKEKTLVAYKTNSEKEMNDLIRRIEGVANLNERYLRQSAKTSNLQRQLHQLRYAVRRMKGMNEGVDHLWQIKETQYVNLNELLKYLRTG